MILNDQELKDWDGTRPITDLLETIAYLKRQLSERDMKLPYPRPCGLCPGQIESKEDLDWHGLGNCVPICDLCSGSGIQPDKVTLDAYVQQRVQGKTVTPRSEK